LQILASKENRPPCLFYSSPTAILIVSKKEAPETPVAPELCEINGSRTSF